MSSSVISQVNKIIETLSTFFNSSMTVKDITVLAEGCLVVVQHLKDVLAETGSDEHLNIPSLEEVEKQIQQLKKFSKLPED